MKLNHRTEQTFLRLAALGVFCAFFFGIIAPGCISDTLSQLLFVEAMNQGPIRKIYEMAEQITHDVNDMKADIKSINGKLK